jgi:hypothetical protein
MKKFLMEWWGVLVPLVALIVILGFNYDPVGDFVERRYGASGGTWAINIILVAAIVYAFLRDKKKRGTN